MSTTPLNSLASCGHLKTSSRSWRRQLTSCVSSQDCARQLPRREQGRMVDEWSWSHAPPNALVPTTRTSGKAPRKKRISRLEPVKRLRLPAREREDSQLYNLKLDINDLKQQIQDLTVRRSLLETRAMYTRFDPNGSVIKTVERYIQNFAAGFRGTNPSQAAFVEWVCDPSFQLGDNPSHGINTLLVQWLRYTELFHIQSFTLNSARIASRDVDQSCVVRCTGSLRGVFTLKSLATVFPHSLKNPAIHSRLLGRDMVCDTSYYFHFTPDGKLKRIDPDTNFFSAINRILKDTRATALVMSDAILDEADLVEEIVVPEEDEIVVTRLPRKSDSRSRFTVVADESQASSYSDNQSETRVPSPVEVSPRESIHYLLS